MPRPKASVSMSVPAKTAFEILWMGMLIHIFIIVGSFIWAASGHRALEDGVAGIGYLFDASRCSWDVWKRVGPLINLAAVFDKLFRLFGRGRAAVAGRLLRSLALAAQFSLP